MIKFFRHIRQRLMTDLPAGKAGNKFSKYMLYAIGEIILVVIGILIALQINNINNNAQQSKVEQQYLLSLQAEFDTNLIKINSCIEENTERVKEVERMLSLFDNNVRDTINDDAISNIFYSVMSGEATYMPAKGVLTDIISSGNLNLIQNAQLRQHLASFESGLDFLKLQETATHALKDKLRSQINKNGSIRKILVDRGANFEHKSISDTMTNREMFRLIEFENDLLVYYLTIKAANGVRFFGGIKERVEQILVEVESQLIK